MKKVVLTISCLLTILSLGTSFAQERDIDIAVVAHGGANNPFWVVVFNAVNDACADFGVSCTYDAPDTFDLPLMAQMIDSAVARGPDALIVSLPDVATLGEPIERAIEQGIPVFSINSGSDIFQDLGILRHIGQTEYEAGLGAGRRFAALGGTQGVCVSHEQGNLALDLRCEGFADGFGGPVEVIASVSSDDSELYSLMDSYLANNPDVDTILAVGPQPGQPAARLLQDLGKDGEVLLGAFDLSPILLEAVGDGTVSFLVDQQQYLQGYLAIQSAVLYDQYKLLNGAEIILTGPGFVDASNYQDVIDLSAQGKR
ncbi:MAG: sugar ABC transporter substrate-binding protein [Deinococcota bacterium]